MAEEAEGVFEIVNEKGLHARAAVKITQLAQRYPCEITLTHSSQMANGKSVMGVLLLIGAKGTMLGVRANGARASEAVSAIGELIAARFGEER